MNGLNAQSATVDYLQLLTIQLQNQDPIDPVDQEGLINDLTQFSILEGIEGLNSSFSDMLSLQELTNGANLVGKNIVFNQSEGNVASGRVSEVFKSPDGLTALVDGVGVPITQILGVAE
ncbi:MAG: flagellar hook capping FlgD N-terminal domain-containing protein [Planctomycetota bacterium]|nr:flagellar hook capping FlgD N-terminal domain-containing protein [Planctomycetota bacterium]